MRAFNIPREKIRSAKIYFSSGVMHEYQKESGEINWFGFQVSGIVKPKIKLSMLTFGIDRAVPEIHGRENCLKG